MKKRFTLVTRNKKYNMIDLDTHDLYVGLWQIFSKPYGKIEKIMIYT